MGIRSWLRGGDKGQQQPDAAPAAAAAVTGLEPSTSAVTAAPPELVHDHASASTFGPPTITASSLPAGGALAAATMGAATAGSQPAPLYDPYEGIAAQVGVGKKVAFKLPEQVEFVFEEEAGVRRRGWAENLQFYTGVGYISGGASGVMAGMYRYLSTKPEFQGPETLKLKANRMLNSAGSFARPFGNGFGILGLYFAVTESYFYNQLDLPGVPDSLNSVLAGAASGALFRVPRGPRQAAVAAGIGAVAGLGISTLRSVFPSL